MSVNMLMTNLDFEDTNLQGLYSNIQGNILKSHGRDHARHIFLRLKGDAAANRALVAKLGAQATDFASQRKQTLAFKASNERSQFVNVMLSATGYAALDIPEDLWPDDKAFRAGMKDMTTAYDTRPRGDHRPVANPLFDDPSSWEAPFQEQIDALVILAYGRKGSLEGAEEFLDEQVEQLSADLGATAEIVCLQKGHVLRNNVGQVIEHFGHPDGIGNPIFMRPDLDRARRTQGGFERADLSAPLGLVLLPEPGNSSGNYGSYFVYRKLQQNITGYKKHCEKLADILNQQMARLRESSGETELDVITFDSDYASALCIGRFKDGTPISEQAVPGWSNLPNNFDFALDIRGRKCPFQSHIRKTNPRLDTRREFGAPQSVEFSRRIVRRGISYGSEDLAPSTEWTDAGLLFLSCQRSIEYQFIFMQHAWLNNQVFLHTGTGLDPICGVTPSDETPQPQKWPLRWGIPEGSAAGGASLDERDPEYLIHDIVRMRGGEYFFAPSKTFLASLA
jgi:Dyp-type peroxidase family